MFEGPNAELREGSLISDHKTLNFDKGLNFEQICPQPPDPQNRYNPVKTVQNGRLATTPTRAWSKDDGSSNKLPQNIRNFMPSSNDLCSSVCMRGKVVSK